VFDDLFQHCHRFLEKRADEILNTNTRVVRAARIKHGAPAPAYDRFIPKAEFITEGNRFSPQGVEWLYLAFATQTSLHGLNLRRNYYTFHGWKHLDGLPRMLYLTASPV
jgi:hypothetical protein